MPSPAGQTTSRLWRDAIYKGSRRLILPDRKELILSRGRQPKLNSATVVIFRYQLYYRGQLPLTSEAFLCVYLPETFGLGLGEEGEGRIV